MSATVVSISVEVFISYGCSYVNSSIIDSVVACISCLQCCVCGVLGRNSWKKLRLTISLQETLYPRVCHDFV